MCTHVHICICTKTDHNSGRHVSLYSWRILMGSCCLNSFIHNILCPLSSPSHFSLMFPYAPPASVPTETTIISVPIEGLLWWNFKVTDSCHWDHPLQDPQSTVLKNSHQKQLGRLSRWGAGQFCSARTSGERCSTKRVSTHYTPSKWNPGKNPTSSQVVKRGWLCGFPNYSLSQTFPLHSFHFDLAPSPFITHYTRPRLSMCSGLLKTS